MVMYENQEIDSLGRNREMGLLWVFSLLSTICLEFHLSSCIHSRVHCSNLLD